MLWLVWSGGVVLVGMAIPFVIVSAVFLPDQILAIVVVTMAIVAATPIKDVLGGGSCNRLVVCEHVCDNGSGECEESIQNVG